MAHIVLARGTGFNTLDFYRPVPLQVELRTVTEALRPLAQPGTRPQIATPAIEQAAQSATPLPNKSRPDDIPQMLNLPLAIYYVSSEVDIRAEPLNEVNLVYPLAPYQQRISGVVRLNIFVNEEGEIDNIVVANSIPPGIFEEAALQAVRELKFSPAIRHGIPVKNRKIIEVTFDPYENINTP